VEELLIRKNWKDRLPAQRAFPGCLSWQCVRVPDSLPEVQAIGSGNLSPVPIC
jgi:hypothetical protein